MSETPGPSVSWWKRLAWLVLIWAASVAALAVIAWLLRQIMQMAGLSMD